MFNVIREAAKIGVGALSLSKENLRKLTDNLAEMGKMSGEEGERLFAELEEAAEEHKKNLSEAVEKTARKVVDQMGLTKKSEVDDLQKRIEELEKKLQEKENPEG